MKILVVGGTSVDEIIPMNQLPNPIPQTLFHQSFTMIGGTGSGKALALKRLGHEVILHSLIGKDDAGQRQIDFFKENGIEFLYDINPQGSETHVNLMSSVGERVSIYTHYGDEGTVVDTDRLRKIASKVNVMILNIIPYVRKLLPLFQSIPIPIWTDLHDYDGKSDYHQPFIEAARFLTLSTENLIDPIAFMQKMILSGKKLLAATSGKLGSVVIDETGVVSKMDIHPITYLDANGAGDSFFSGLLTAYYQGEDIRVAHAKASISAALTVASKAIAAETLSWETVNRIYQDKKISLR